ncbi:MAG: hypothetical protein RL131_450 [Bacteroidota bacterium]|jgi:predicted O-methyltransferase YrrM
MYTSFELAFRYIRYFFTADNGKGHGIHSPFVFSFVQEVLIKSRKSHDVFIPIENKRRELKASNQMIDVLDYGAGSTTGNRPQRSVGSIAKTAAKPARFGRLMYHLVQFYHVESVLELGTSLGLSTRYLAAALQKGSVISIEGSPEIARFTSSSLQQEGYKHVKIIEGEFDARLPEALSSLTGRKLVFFDGNHRYEPTMRYFNEVMAGCSEEDILVFDDIHWSREMEKAWQEIKNNKQVTLTIDLFFIGLVFFRKEFKEKQDFIIRF